MVTAFEWIALGLILFGMVIPFWFMSVIAGRTALRQAKEGGNPHQVMRYTELMDYLHSALKKSEAKAQSGASLVAAIRDLNNYPQHSDLTILFLEELSVTGTSKFDDLAKIEIKKIETKFLGFKND